MRKAYSYFYSGENRDFYRFSGPTRGYIYYPRWRIELATGKKEILNSQDWQRFFNEFSKLTSDYQVVHLFYEMSYLLHNVSGLTDDTVLAITLSYTRQQKVTLSRCDSTLEFTPLHHRRAVFSSYQKQFAQVQKELHAGRAYQINLTRRFSFQIKGMYNLSQVMQHFFRGHLAGLAHATVLPELNIAFFSNSPECLSKIDLERKSIETFPIKGTAENSPRFLQELNSKKNQAELNIISDLLRNDLSAYTQRPTEIIKKKALLQVHRLFHRYSHLRSPFQGEIDYQRFLQALFPGGSITGAPKLSVIKTIQEIEKDPRGFYTGSTFLFKKNQRKIYGSINIRSGTLDTTTHCMTLGAGGGITLLSDVEEEFLEMLAKIKSFF